MRVGILTGEEHGSNYFRGELVKRALRRRGIECFHTACFDAVEFRRVDVAYMIRPFFISGDAVPQIHALRRAGVPIVMDADDQFYAVPNWSPASGTTHRWSVRQSFTAGYAAADVIVTPSRTLARIFGAKFPQAEVRIIPNAFDREAKLLKPGLPPGTKVKPVVGWAGGAQHQGDLAAIEGVWDACLSKGWDLAFIGDVPASVNGRKRTTLYPSSGGVEMYQQTLSLARFCVGLAPLLDCEFNRCKSSLKAVEYMHLSGCPMVLQDLDPYYEVEADGEWVQKVRGHDTSAWVSAIERALEAYQREGTRYYLPPQYDLANTTDAWIAAFQLAHAVARGHEVDEAMMYAPGVTGPLKAVATAPSGA